MRCEFCHGHGEDLEGEPEDVCDACLGTGRLCDICENSCDADQDLCDECHARTGGGMCKNCQN
jgi:hypothetical protein